MFFPTRWSPSELPFPLLLERVTRKPGNFVASLNMSVSPDQKYYHVPQTPENLGKAKQERQLSSCLPAAGHSSSDNKSGANLGTRGLSEFTVSV